VGFLWLPYIGVNVPTGKGSDGLSPGLRLGGIFGFNLPPFLSLNGELTIDILNPDTPGGYDSATAVMVDFTFSPFLHFGLPGLEIVAGPKIGGFGYALSASASGPDERYSGSGLAYGVNVGFFIPLGRVAIGGLFNFTGHHFSSECENDAYTGYVEVCGNPRPGTSDTKILGFSGALLY
jgi:hypothetical protein